MYHPVVSPAGGCRKPFMGFSPFVAKARPDLSSGLAGTYFASLAEQNALCTVSNLFSVPEMLVIGIRIRIPSSWPWKMNSVPRLAYLSKSGTAAEQRLGLASSFRQSCRHFDNVPVISPVNFYQLGESYQDHPEAKCLGPDGEASRIDTRGLLQRAHILAAEHIKIGKESDRHWEQGEDVSLLEFKAIQYKRRGNAIATAEQLRHIEKVRKFRSGSSFVEGLTCPPTLDQG
jgi:hypothetical protein